MMDPQQEMSNETLETILVSSTKGSNNKKMEEEMKKKMGKGELGGEAQKCPRCQSPNTKFCYYNNYSLTQPRYFCKSCRRYWTKGGTLRNVPVGGGCRRNKRSSSSSFSKNNNNKPINFHNDPLHNPLITGMPSSFGYNSIDLNLAFATLHKHSSSQAPTSFGFGGDLSIYGNSANAASDVFGNGGIFEGQNGNFNNGSFCYGFMPGNENESKTSILGVSLEGNQRKQENVNNSNNNVAENPSKVLWGLPWQISGDSTGVVPEIDPGRESWNGLASSWHNGLLNTPLV